jgi:hypothetical protein
MDEFQYDSATLSRFVAFRSAVESLRFYLERYFDGSCGSAHDFPHGGGRFSQQAEDHGVGIEEPSHVSSFIKAADDSGRTTIRGFKSGAFVHGREQFPVSGRVAILGGKVFGCSCF